MIVIDSVALFYSLFNAKDLICGGRLGEVFDNFENLLKKLKEIGAILVFFSRLNAHKFSREWMSRCRQRFAINIKMYDHIRSGGLLSEITTFIEDQEVKNTPPALSELYAIAREYGEYRFTTSNIHSEMASFAKRDEARAIISDNSEFFIFEGDWKLWSAKHFKFDPRNQNKIKTAQFDRGGIAKVIGIDPIHRPLFATLMGNEHGEGFRDDLKKFQKSLGMDRFKKVAQYAKNARRDKDGTLDFERISSEVFGVCDDKYIRFLKRSVNSYKLKNPPERKWRKIMLFVSETIYNRDFLMSTDDQRVIILGFYDLRGKMGMETLPVLFMKWDQRKTGILNKVCKKQISGNVFAKFELDEGFDLKPSEPIKPDCNEHIEYSSFFSLHGIIIFLNEFSVTVPDIEGLYCSTEATDIKWKMLSFIMEFDNDIVTAIKSLPREFRLVCTTVLVLVKVLHLIQSKMVMNWFSDQFCFYFMFRVVFIQQMKQMEFF